MHLLAPALVLLFAMSSHGSGNDHASVGHDITISEEGSSGDVACAFCSVHLHGDVAGDVAVFWGDVTVDEDRSVRGDVAVAGGNVNLKDAASIHGDLALVAGDLNLAPMAAIHGDRAVMSSRLWLLLPLLPFAVLAGFIWLIVWLVRRNRYPQRYRRL